MTKAKAGPTVEVAFRLPAGLAREYLDFMGIAHMMGNLDAEMSPRDRVDMALAGLLRKAMGRDARAKGRSGLRTKD